MKKIVFFLAMSQSVALYAGDGKDFIKCIGDSYTVSGRTSDKTLKPKGTKAIFTFKNQSGGIISGKIMVSWKTDSLELHPNKSGITSMLLTAGTYKFCFRTKDYRVLKTDTILLKKQQRTEIQVYLETNLPIDCDKPVIYVYPPQTMNVNIQLTVKGETSFTYPAYNNGWDFTADPDGTIHMNGNTYNYLFWESKSTLQNTNSDVGKGFIVDSKELVLFFEKSLAEMGFNSKEAADFITYWCPRMLVNEKNYIHFIFNEACNAYAGLDIVPAPDNLLRVYMLWSPAENGDKLAGPQELPKLKREGFTVLEWGGIEMKTGKTISKR